jgi:hypothetical protein
MRLTHGSGTGTLPNLNSTFIEAHVRSRDLDETIVIYCRQPNDGASPFRDTIKLQEFTHAALHAISH